MAIHQETTFNADAKKLFAVLTNGDEFAKATGAPASIDAKPGGAFSCFGDQITGRFIELVAGERIVQAWRASAWDAGVYSVARFTIAADGNETRLVLDHTGYPEAMQPHLEGGWGKMYWEPLKAYFD